jgi:hypothetical protein
MEQSSDTISVSGAVLELASEKYNLMLRDVTIQEELNSVQNKKSRLFSESTSLDKDTTELFRAMCILSQCGSRPGEISSHRPIMGKFIIFMKKLAWKIVEPQIKHVFNGISDCFSCLILSHADLLERIKKLENEQNNRI